MNDGEDYFNLIAEEFVSKNKDVEHFLKKSAISSTRLHQSATYLVFIENEVAGFFTLAIKSINVLADILSKKEQKRISRLSKLDEKENVYSLPAILIAQFSRNFNKELETISGDTLMDITKQYIFQVQDMVGGILFFLECENEQKIINFYEKHNFKNLDSSRITKNNKELLQMYSIR